MKSSLARYRIKLYARGVKLSEEPSIRHPALIETVRREEMLAFMSQVTSIYATATSAEQAQKLVSYLKGVYFPEEVAVTDAMDSERAAKAFAQAQHESFTMRISRDGTLRMDVEKRGV